MNKLSYLRKELLRLIIQSDPAILSKVLNDNEVSGPVEVTDDGFVIFYKKGSPKWFQQLFRDVKQVSLLDMAIHIADAITGIGNGRNKRMFDGITKAILEQAVDKKDLDCVVDVLFDSLRNGTDGVLSSKYITNEDIQRRVEEIASKDPKLQFTVGNDIYAFASILTPNGRTIPIRLGKVK